jgi:hypothetical protein
MLATDGSSATDVTAIGRNYGWKVVVRTFTVNSGFQMWAMIALGGSVKRRAGSVGPVTRLSA